MDLYDTVALGFRAGWRALALDVASEGHDHIPRRGPAILASNHIGYLDFCFVALTPPTPRRQVRFLIRHDVFDHRLVGWALRGMAQIPLDVHGDPRPGLRQATDTLRRGEVVGVHPEGTISPSFVPRPGRSGATRLAQRTGAPVIPVGLWGSQRLLTKWRPRRLTRGIAVRVVYGAPFHVAEDDDVTEATRALDRRIVEVVGRAQAIYPQRPAGGEDWWVRPTSAVRHRPPRRRRPAWPPRRRSGGVAPPSGGTTRAADPRVQDAGRGRRSAPSSVDTSRVTPGARHGEARLRCCGAPPTAPRRAPGRACA